MRRLWKSKLYKYSCIKWPCFSSSPHIHVGLHSDIACYLYISHPCKGVTNHGEPQRKQSHVYVHETCRWPRTSWPSFSPRMAQPHTAYWGSGWSGEFRRPLRRCINLIRQDLASGFVSPRLLALYIEHLTLI